MCSEINSIDDIEYFISESRVAYKTPCIRTITKNYSLPNQIKLAI